jgi:nucleoside-diphosphate-sugar epimerase
VSVNQVLEIVQRLAGRRLEIRRESKQKGDMRDTYADTSRARADIGFSPSVSIEDGLAAEYDWLKAALGRA